MFSAMDSPLSAAENSARLLKRQRSCRQQVLDGIEQFADGMTRRCGAKIIGGDVQVDLPPI